MPPKPPKNEVEADDEEDEEENQQIPDHLIRILDGLAQEVLSSVFLICCHDVTLSNNSSIDRQRACSLSRERACGSGMSAAIILLATSSEWHYFDDPT